ncbi:MAG: lamin tail domain-containing protein [Pedosphaera sp.]|nr:lamin tail domain-containing protein [Pedosphaera sp.]
MNNFLYRVVVVWAGLAAFGARSDQVVINEVMYNPRGDAPEWIELSNITATPFDIAGWKLRGDVELDFPSFDGNRADEAFLGHWQKIILTNIDSGSFRQQYGIPSSVKVFGPWTGSLPNEGGRIVVRDKNSVLVCTLGYNDRGRWPVAADGTGHTLVLQNSDLVVDDGRNWSFSKRSGGTPGGDPILGVETPVASPEVNLSSGIVLLDYGDRWKYNDENRNRGTTWRRTTYNDASWKSGFGLLGLENSALPDPGIKTEINKGSQLCYYFRKQFTYNGDPSEVTLTIDQIVDDGAVYYLNGSEVGRSRMPGGAVSFTTRTSATVGNAVEEKGVVTIAPGKLKNGSNVLAVEVHQTNTTSSDIVFGCRLSASVPAAKGVVINEIHPIAGKDAYIEFYNPTDKVIDLRGYYLSDDSGDLDKRRVSRSLKIEARSLATISFTAARLSVKSPVTVYVTKPDGKTVVTAIRADVALDGRTIGRKPSGGSEWFLFSDATPGTANMSRASLGQALRLNEVHYTSEGAIDWVEVYNGGDGAVNLDGLSLATRRDFSDRTPLLGEVPGYGRNVIAVDFEARGQMPIYLLNGDSVLQAELLDRPEGEGSVQAFPEGGNEWFTVAKDTKGHGNNPARHENVIINEVMFNPPSDHRSGEYIELFNRDTEAIDLSGWRFVDGVNFAFPSGASIAAGGYLVVAADTDYVRRVYKLNNVLGNYDGELSNPGELLRLEDADGNLADEVEYSNHGNWPGWTKGGGSSMELVNPWADNRLPSAWRDSDETTKSSFREYTTTGRWRQLKTMGGATDYREFHMHLVGDSEIVLSEIQAISSRTKKNVLTNANKMSTNNRSANGWLSQGNHWATYMNGQELHLISDGHGDNRPNRMEIDMSSDIRRNDDLTIKFKARWVRGNPRLIAWTWDKSVAGSFLVEIPENLGTPGKRNSTFASNTPPQVDELLHSPAVPTSSQSVRVTARITSVDPLSLVSVRHRADSSNNTGSWKTKTMYDDGSRGGDEVGGDGIFTGTLTEYRNNGRRVQFYVEARTESGTSHSQPKWGPDRPALYVVDNRKPKTDLRTVRLVVSDYDMGAVSNGGSSKYKYKFPRLSNHYFNATFISNEKDIRYNCEMRNSGSPWTRGNHLNRGKWKMPNDRRFRGKYKLSWDDDANGRVSRNRLTRYMLYLMGHVVNENEMIWFTVNSSSPQMREEVEPVANDFLSRNFTDGVKGNLYRIDDEWWFTDSWDRQNRNADWSYKSSDNPGRYRSEWMKRTNEWEDDYSALINLFKTVRTSYKQEQIERLVDPHQTMIMSMVRGYIDDWDSFSLRRGKNGYFYQRYDDGKFQFLHWDSDLAYGNASSRLYQGMPGFSSYINKPYNKRLFYSYLAEFTENYTYNSPRMNAWLAAEERVSSSYSARASEYKSFFSARRNTVKSELGTNYSRKKFEITTNQGGTMNFSSDRIALKGTSPYGVIKLRVEGHPEAKPVWTGLTTWTINGIQLHKGEQTVKVLGTDQWGNLRSQDEIKINKSSNAAPVAVLKSQPASWNVLTDDVLKLDARESYDPEGQALVFDWSASNLGEIELRPFGQARAEAVFTRPGLYAFTVKVTDEVGKVSQVEREAAVYGTTGFSGFSDPILEDYWSSLNVKPRRNFSPDAWYSLDDVPGWLELQLLNTAAKPLAKANPQYPFINRPLPSKSDWALQAKLRLVSRQYGDYDAGLMTVIGEGWGAARYTVGFNNGTKLMVRKVSRSGTVTTLKTQTISLEQIAVRIVREGDTLVFEWKVDDAWKVLHRSVIFADTPAVTGGLFLATEKPQSIRVGFDYAMLVDPSAVSPLKGNLSLSEVMYNPIGGDAFEYLELLNAGSSEVNLRDAQFDRGITYRFGNLSLAAGERIVVAKNRESFLSRYGTVGIRLADGQFEGRLKNGGETIALIDGDGDRVFEVDYGDSGDWPGRADGNGSSLEVIDPQLDLNNAANWNSSIRYHGTPGDGIGLAPTVVINEVMAHSDLPLEDAIELHNLGQVPVDIGGWFLSDSANNLRKYRIPDDTTISAGGYVVFYEQSFLLENDDSGFSLSSARGDEVWLTEVDLDGTPARFADKVDFGPSANGVSLGRFPNGTGPFVAMVDQSLGTPVRAGQDPSLIASFRAGKGAPNSGPLIGPIVISEIMYAPAEGLAEYVVLKNISDVSVSFFDPANPGNTWELANAISFTFPPNFVLPAGESLYVGGVELSQLRAQYELDKSIQVLGPFDGRLNNAGESLQLLRPDAPQTLPPNIGLVPYILVEKVKYSGTDPWPVMPGQGGVPIQRINLSAYGNTSSNWTKPGDEKDSDLDGMPDRWEIAQGFDLQDAGDALLDADGDRLTNLQEYAAGTDPHDAESGLKLELIRLPNGMLRVSFEGVQGKSYSLQSSMLLGQEWQPLSNFFPKTSSKVSRTISPRVSPERFFRLITPAIP